MISVGELVGTISLNDKFSGPLGNVSSALGPVGAGMTALAGFAVAAGVAIAAVTDKIIDMGVHGSDVADVQEAFAGMTTRAGQLSDVMLGRLQEGTLGTISNFELMQLANRTLSGGMVTTAKDMGTLAEGAKMMGDRIGGSTSEAFETLSKALTKGTTKAEELKFLFEGSDAAIQRYADSLGRPVSSLSDAEKASIKTQVGLANLRAELEANGPATVDFSDRIAQAHVAFTNFTDDLSVAIARSPVLAAGMDAMGKAITDAFGGNSEQAIRSIVGLVNDFGIGLMLVAGVAVDAASIIVGQWQSTKIVFATVLEVLSSGIATAAGLLATLTERAMALPVIGSQFDNLAGGMRTISDIAERSAGNFQLMKESAVTAAIDTSAAFDTAKLAIDNTVVAMMLAGDTAPDLGAKVEEFIVRPLGTDVPNAAAAGARGIDELHGRIQAAAPAMAAELESMFFQPVNSSWQELTTTGAAEFEAMVQTISTYADIMRINVTGAIEAIRRAQAAATASQEIIDQAAFQAKMNRWAGYLSMVSADLRMAFGQNKAAAIAAGLIDTASAVLKALASAPPPWNYVLAAAAGVAGLIQVNRIRSQGPGFALGTPGTSFQDFGAESTVRVHGREAIVNQPQAATLADMLAGARDETAARTEAAIERLGDRLSRDQRRAQEALPIMLRDAVLMGAA